MSWHSLNSRNNKTVNHSVHSSLEIRKPSSSPWDNITSILSGLQSSMDSWIYSSSISCENFNVSLWARADIPIEVCPHSISVPSKISVWKSQFVSQLQTFSAETTSILFSRICWTRRIKWFFFLKQCQRKITLWGELKTLLDLLNNKCWNYTCRPALGPHGHCRNHESVAMQVDTVELVRHRFSLLRHRY